MPKLRMQSRRFSIRVRLTLALGVILLVGLITSDVATYKLVSNFLSQRLDSQLAQARLPIERYLEQLKSGQCASISALEDLADPNTYILTFNLKAFAPVDNIRSHSCSQHTSIINNPEFPSGYQLHTDPVPKLPAVIHFSHPISGRVYDPRLSNQNLSSFQVGAVSDKNFQYRVQAVPLPRGAELIVAAPLQPLNSTLENLIDIEAVVSSGALVLMILFAIIGVRRGLSPLVGMAAKADSIAAGDFSQRVNPADSLDETGRLGLALNEMLSQIESAFNAKEMSELRLRRFLADISHELRTPLTSIRGYAELFFRGAKNRPDDLERVMERIHQEAERMNVLVDDLLLLVRLDQGRELNLGQVEVRKLLQQVVNDLSVIHDTSSVILFGGVDVELTGDKDRLYQLFSNLIANALVHNPPQTIISVKVMKLDNHIQFDIADNGQGIVPEALEYVFDRFVTGKSYESNSNAELNASPIDKNKSGSGLGLAIARAITHGHLGTITVKSIPGIGTTFTVILPVSKG